MIMTELKKAYNEIVSVKIGEDIVSMTIVQKQNQSGLKFNQRLFILVHNQFFGYISKVNLDQTAQKIDIHSAKVKVLIKNLFVCQTDDSQLKIQFTTKVEDKIIPKEWVFQMTSDKLAQFWKKLLDYQVEMRNKNKKTARKLEKSEKSLSKQKSQKVQKSFIREEPKIQTDRSKKQEKKVQITTPQAAGTFDADLFSEESDGDKKTKNKKIQTSRSSPQKSNTKRSNYDSDEKPKDNKKRPNLTPIQTQDKKQQKKTVKREQKKWQIKQQKNQQTQNKLNQSRVQIKLEQSTLNLPQIKEQIESMKSQESKMKRQLEPVKQSIFSGDQQDLDFSIKKDSIYSKKKSSQRQDSARKSAYNGRMITSKPKTKEKQLVNVFDYESQTRRIVVTSKEEQNVQFVKDVLSTLDQKNKKFPIHQITYKREEMSDLINAYKDRISSNINNRDSQHLLNLIMQTQRQKLRQTYRSKSPKGNRNNPNWLYRQITQQQTPYLVAFKHQCSELMKEIICEVYQNKFQKFKAIKNDNNLIELQYEDLKIKVALADRSQPKNKQSDAAEKSIKNQFKIYQYLYRIIENRGIVRVPLNCLCSHAGLTALFKVKGVFYEKDKYEDNLKNQLDRLEDISCLPLNKALKGKIRPLNEFYYCQMRSGETDNNFKYHFIDEISQIFVYDLNNQGITSKVLRMELIEQQIRGKILPFIPQDQVKNKSMFTKDFHTLSQKLIQRVQKIAIQLDNMEFYFVSPTQLSKLMHKNGVNMRYLGSIYLKITNQFNRSCLLSQIMARTCKKILSKSLQQTFFQQKMSQKLSFDHLQNSLNAKMTDFLNCLLGNNHQTQAFWRIVKSNAEQYYKVKLESIQGLSKGQLLVSLAYHLKLLFKWNEIDAGQVFQKASFFKQQQNFEMKITSKGYKPLKNKKIIQIQSKFKRLNQQNFKFIIDQLNLKRANFSDQIKEQQIVNELRLYLCNFIEPQQLDWSNSYSHLSLYLIGEPSKINFRIDLQAVKWFLRKNNKFKYLNKFNEITSKLLKLYGNNHPILSQLYQTFSDHHISKLEVQDALNFLKMSIVNISALCGDNNQLIARKYYKISEFLIQNKRDNQALQYLKKSKKIVQLCTQKNIVLYAKTRLLLAVIYFNQKKYQAIINQLENSKDLLQIYEREAISYEQQRVKYYYLLYTSYINLKKTQEASSLCTHLESKLKYFKKNVNYQQILWIIISNSIKTSPAESQQALFNIINTMETIPSINFYKKAFDLLRERDKQKCLFKLFKSYSVNSPRIREIINEKRMLDDWKNLAKVYDRESLFDFISILQQLIYFLGRDRLNSISSN